MIRSKVVQLAVAVGMLVGAQSVFAQCSTAAWTGAATTATAGLPTAGFPRYSGRCSLRAAAVGQFVTDGSPNGTETSYNARFYTAAPAFTGEADIFQARDTGGTNIIRVTYDGAQFKFYVNGTANTAVVAAAPNRYYGVEVRWTAAGTFTALVKGAAAVNATTVTISGFTGGTIDTARLGWISGGTLAGGATAPHFDEFDSRRTSTIGFLCRGDANGDRAINIFDRGIVNQDINAQNGIVGANLAIGQPDANEDFAINIFDRGIINGLIVSNPNCAL